MLRVSDIIQRKYIIALVIAVVVGLCAMAYVALMRHWSLGSYHFDLGNMHQAVYNTAHGRFLEVTDPNLFYQSNRLAYHFDPILAFFAPLYLLYGNAEVLIIGQALLLALGAIPLFLLARKVLKKDIYGLAFALLYLLYYPIHFTAIADFHAVVLSTTFLLYMFYFAEEDRFFLSGVFMILAWLTKENVTFITAMFGVYHLFIKKNVRFGLITIMTSSVLAVFLIKFLIPSMRVSGEHLAGGYYTTNVFENLQRLFRRESFDYLNILFRPLLYVSFFSPIHLMIAAPEFLINLLSKNGNMRTLQYHYTALLTPFIFISAIYGLKNMESLFKHLISKKNAGFFLPIFLEVMVVVMLFVFLIKSPLQNSHYVINQRERSEVLEWQKKLSDNTIKISSTGHLSPYFSGREYFYNFFFDFAYEVQGFSEDDIKKLSRHYEKADYVLIKESEITSHTMVKYYYADLLNNSAFEKISDENGIEVFKNTSK